MKKISKLGTQIDRKQYLNLVEYSYSINQICTYYRRDEMSVTEIMTEKLRIAQHGCEKY